MECLLMKDKLFVSQSESVKRRPCATSGTIASFLIYVTGAILILFGLLDIVIRINSLKTAGYLVIGLVMYKVGHGLLNYYAAFKIHPERRRTPQR